MSFFGFDTSLPRDKPGASKGIFEHSNPFNEVAKARKLQAFQGDEEEMYVDRVISFMCSELTS